VLSIIGIAPLLLVLLRRLGVPFSRRPYPGVRRAACAIDPSAGDRPFRLEGVVGSRRAPALDPEQGVHRPQVVRITDQLLAEIAEFLLRAEPHSPTPYLIKRAVAWGRMPLAEVLQELVRDPNDLRAVYALLGIEGGGGT